MPKSIPVDNVIVKLAANKARMDLDVIGSLGEGIRFMAVLIVKQQRTKTLKIKNTSHLSRSKSSHSPLNQHIAL